MFAYVFLHLHLFVIPLIYWNAHFKYIKKSIVSSIYKKFKDMIRNNIMR